MKPFCDDFWFGRDTDPGPAVTQEMVEEAEARLGVRLPGTLAALLQKLNGGYPRNGAFPMRDPDGVVWPLEIDAIYGLEEIARQETWLYVDGAPKGLVEFAWAEGDFAWRVCLDYRACEPQGEPSVVVLDPENPGEPTMVAPDFDAFVSGLVSAEKHDCYGIVTKETDRVAIWRVVRGTLDLTDQGEHPGWAGAPWKGGRASK